MGNREKPGATTGQGEDPGILGAGRLAHERVRGHEHWAWTRLRHHLEERTGRSLSFGFHCCTGGMTMKSAPEPAAT